MSDRLDIDAALAALPEDYRAAVVLRDHLGLDYAEIAEVLDLPPGTVRIPASPEAGRAWPTTWATPVGQGNPAPADDVQGGAP